MALDVTIEHSCHSWLPSCHRASWWFPLAVASRWLRVLQRESSSPRTGDGTGEPPDSGAASGAFSPLNLTFPLFLEPSLTQSSCFPRVPHMCFNVAWTSTCRASYVPGHHSCTVPSLQTEPQHFQNKNPVAVTKVLPLGHPMLRNYSLISFGVQGSDELAVSSLTLRSVEACHARYAF